jgi:hypothetical protein
VAQSQAGRQAGRPPTHIRAPVFVFFVGTGGGGRSILRCSQSGDGPQEDLARFGYMLNMKVKFLNMLLYFCLTYLKRCVKIRSLKFIYLFQIMTIWKTQKTLFNSIF